MTTTPQLFMHRYCCPRWPRFWRRCNRPDCPDRGLEPRPLTFTASALPTSPKRYNLVDNTSTHTACPAHSATLAPDQNGECRPVQYSALQYSTIRYNTVQYNTTVPYSIQYTYVVQYMQLLIASRPTVTRSNTYSQSLSLNLSPS